MKEPMELELNGNVAVITGGASEIGLACARGLARELCRIAIWDASAGVLEAAAAQKTEPVLGNISHHLQTLGEPGSKRKVLSGSWGPGCVVPLRPYCSTLRLNPR